MKYLTLLFLGIVLIVSTAAQSGGPYIVTQTTLGSGGGGGSSGGSYAATGTTGQPGAGENPRGGPYSVVGGFWHPVLLPTAAMVSIAGRVTTADGLGLRNATVVLSGGGLQTQRIVTTGSFGYFTFTDVEVGRSYVVTVESRRYNFTPGLVSVMDEIADLNFVAEP